MGEEPQVPSVDLVSPTIVHGQLQVWGVLAAGLGEKSGRFLWVQVDTEKSHLISRSCEREREDHDVHQLCSGLPALHRASWRRSSHGNTFPQFV